jgi:hypothetical protein
MYEANRKGDRGMKIFTGEIPECHITPNEAVQTYDGEIAARVEDARMAFKEGQLSILNQCVEVSLNTLYNEYQDYLDYGDYAVSQTFEEFAAQFIQSEIKKQESKDGK